MMGRLKKGLVHVYTGPGKGKTTAALGLALRASGAGLRVSIYQFIKARPSSEMKALKRLRKVSVEQCGKGHFIKERPGKADRASAKAALVKIGKAMSSGIYDVIILDEVNVAAKIGLIETDELISLIEAKPDAVELILTGRGADRAVRAYADYVTYFSKMKHPFDAGILARKGIEY